MFQRNCKSCDFSFQSVCFLQIFFFRSEQKFPSVLYHCAKSYKFSLSTFRDIFDRNLNFPKISRLQDRYLRVRKPSALAQARATYSSLKGYSSGQSHFSEINAKLAEEYEFVTHFIQKCLETRENEQNVVLNESSEALGNRSEIVRILVLAMTTADDGVGGSNSVREFFAHFSLVYKQNGAFWVH